MNKTINTKNTLFFTALLAGAAFLASCGDNGTDPDPEPAKTLNQELIHNADGKKWYRQGITSSTHTFYSDGQYGPQGTWKWLGDSQSDSMEIWGGPGENPRTYYFEYCEADEMKMSSTRGSATVFKTSAW